jgi:DEAD/DEAH box helicase domain-containing protein
MKAIELIESMSLPEQPERVDFLPREERNVAIPDWLAQSPITPWLQRELKNKNRLWSHQAVALEAALRNENVALSTGTNSGKSLIPQILFLHKLMMEKNGTFAVVLPLTALNRDQLARWEVAAEILNLPPEWFLKIDGSVDPKERLERIQKARLLFITPHSFHGWFLDNLDDLGVQRFLRYMRAGFLDEIHTYDEVMGTNAAFLFRRLIVHHETLNPDHEIQWIAASGSIGRPKAFLKTLLDRDFTIIGSKQDGSKQNRRSVFHVQADTYGDILKVGKKIAIQAVDKGMEGLAFFFIDSRDVVESMTAELREALGKDWVMPFSAKSTQDDIAYYMPRIANGDVKIIVTTSALESGVHFPNASLVINADIPLFINRFHQRLGRVGRGDDEAAMVLLGDRAKFGHFERDTEEKGLAAYVHTLAENPALNLDNKAMGFINAQCLITERKRLGTTKPLVSSVHWPFGTNALILTARREKKDVPLELRPLKLAKNRSPNREFPLLNTGERRCFAMLRGRELNELSVDQALRECAPGGTYRQGGKYYFVLGWDYQKSRFSPGAWHIKLDYSTSNAVTHSILVQEVHAQLHRAGVLQDHFLCHSEGPEHGFLAEMHILGFTKIVGCKGRILTPQGYRSFKFKYRDMEGDSDVGEFGMLDGEEIKMSKFFAQKIYKHTSGVVMYMPDRWFGEDARRFIAEALVTSYMSARGKEIFDPARLEMIRYDTSNLLIHHNVSEVMEGGALAVFDGVQCSLRLTERMFTNFRELLEDALRESSDERRKTAIQHAIEWYQTLIPQPLPSPREFVQGKKFAPPPVGYVLAYAPGSVVDRERDGIRTAYKVAGYERAAWDTKGTFSYRLQAPYLDTRQWVNLTFNSAGEAILDRKLENLPKDAILIVPEDQVDAPMDHTRFSYVWLKLATFEMKPPEVTQDQPGISGSVLKPGLS